jgi:SnoaL-like domain
MTERNALDNVTAYLDALMGKDLGTAASYLAEDFVFEGPIRRYKSAHEFLVGFEAFAQHIRPGWRKIAAFGDDRGALLMYDLALVSGGALRVADYYTVKDGKLQTETLAFDTHGFR